ncbi:MAG TPA: TdeIII family type II restriction endonuclease [Anaerolineae bacterium]|nr:TdeIII family type II restriction endonuclease [Anaerolineae bacterium]
MPGDPREMKAAIQSVIKDLMDRVMQRVLFDDKFEIEKIHKTKPLYAALVPEEILKGAHFERRFVTPFGGVWETLAVTAAQFGLGFGAKGHSIFGAVRSERLARITEVLNALEHPEKGKERQKPDWDTELTYVLEGGGEDVLLQIVCDVYAMDTTSGEKYAFELKAPLPNSDQSKVSKEKLLKLYSMEPPQVTAAYYALPYNPYESRETYDWSFPARWFNMKTDKVVLIGDEFWEKIGGLGTYQTFIAAVNEIGPAYKKRIYEEYLGITPPNTLGQAKPE